MYFILSILILLFIFIICNELYIYDVTTFDITHLFTKRNTVFTLNSNAHYPMIEILFKYLLRYHHNDTKILHILEIGAGNGISTKNFLDMLHMSNYNFHYTVNEYYQSYRDSLTKIVTNYNINYENKKNNKNNNNNNYEKNEKYENKNHKNKRKYENYENKTNTELFIMPFESLSFFNNEKKYDIILLTAASALNNNNIHLFKSLTHRDTIIITICPYCFTYVLRRYFYIIDMKACSVILGIFLLQVK